MVKKTIILLFFREGEFGNHINWYASVQKIKSYRFYLKNIRRFPDAKAKLMPFVYYKEKQIGTDVFYRL